jgi:hypothetical protein
MITPQEQAYVQRMADESLTKLVDNLSNLSKREFEVLAITLMEIGVEEFRTMIRDFPVLAPIIQDMAAIAFVQAMRAKAERE